MVRTCELFVVELFLAFFTNDKKILAQLKKLKRAIILFSSMGLTLFSCPQIEEVVSFPFSFSKTGKKFSLR